MAATRCPQIPPYVSNLGRGKFWAFPLVSTPTLFWALFGRRSTEVIDPKFDPDSASTYIYCSRCLYYYPRGSVRASGKVSCLIPVCGELFFWEERLEHYQINISTKLYVSTFFCLQILRTHQGRKIQNDFGPESGVISIEGHLQHFLSMLFGCTSTIFEVGNDYKKIQLNCIAERGPPPPNGFSDRKPDIQDGDNSEG